MQPNHKNRLMFGALCFASTFLAVGLVIAEPAPQMIRSSTAPSGDAPSGKLVLKVFGQDDDSRSVVPFEEHSRPPSEPSGPGGENEELEQPTFLGEPIGKTNVFVIDVSCSMHATDVGGTEDCDGNSVANASRLDLVRFELVRMLRQLTDEQEFDFVWLAGYSPNQDKNVWRGELVPATDENVECAIETIMGKKMWLGTPTFWAVEYATHNYGHEIDYLALLSDGEPIPQGAGYWGTNHQSAILEQFPGWFAPMKAKGCELAVFHVGQSVIAGTFLQDFAARNGADYRHN